MFVDTALNVGADAIASAYPFISLHTAGAVTSSADESTAARIAAGWTAAANGDITIANKDFTGGTASGPCVRVGYWSLAVDGVYGGGCLLVGDQAFNSAGEYHITSVTENGSSS